VTPNSKSRNIAKVSDRKRGKIQMTDLNFDFDSVREKAKAELEIVESTPFDADKSLESAKKHHSIVSTINQINKMKKEVILRILIDSENDEFGIKIDAKGFNEKTPLQNSLLIASVLDIARKQELDKFPLRSEN